MKKTFLLLIMTPLFVLGQQDSTHTKTKKPAKTAYFGIKAGLNFSNVTNASSIGAGSQTGFHAGIFFNTGGKVLGARIELLYSQQGYHYTTDSSEGTATHSYIYLAELMAVNITRFVQVQAGFQTGYLLNAKVDNSKSTGNATVDNILSYYNRFDYGFSGGLEIHPLAGLLVGARYNISFSNLYNNTFSNPSGGSGTYNPYPSTTGVDFKNNVVQVFLGYRF